MFSKHPGRIVELGVLEPEMLPLHQLLVAALHEAEGHPLSCQTLFLKSSHPLQQLWNLQAFFHPGFVIPEPMVLGSIHAGLRQLRVVVANIEPLYFQSWLESMSSYLKYCL